MGCPLATYIKDGEEEADQEGRRAMGGSPTRTPNLVGFAPLSYSKLKKGGRRRRREGRRGAPPPPLVQFRLARGERATSLPALSLLH